ncbi:hypothetical protein JXC34_03910, partial [Candidatus Woesearchaeota archaeon]|nr:hypothetical protein [Candidatus Woesearchaeota archaeon]
MKHNLKVTLFLMLLFFSAQIIGLFLLNLSIESIQSDEEGNIVVQYSEPLTGRPEIEGQESFIYILGMVFLGTAILLGIIKLGLFRLWKAWFFLAIWGALAIALSVIMSETAAILISLGFTILKIFKPNIIVHNLTEVFMYGGIAILISPLFTVFWGVMLLLAISIYDMIAVWKLKHMITLATAQAEKKMFAGLLIPYQKEDPLKQPTLRKEKIKKEIATGHKAKIRLDLPEGFHDKDVKSAILGGGDIAFPLLFSGSVMTWLIETGLPKEIAFLQALIVSFFAGVALFMLFIKSKKDKFYPAMPF